jgi:threonylcarbamoyladenosine tRNA methylthiotransferase MtaB
LAIAYWLFPMKIAITTLGCKINQYDSAVIQDRLAGKHSFVDFEAAADCVIINTCTVTDRADWEARHLVRRAKRANPAAKIIVTGCYAQVNPAEVARVPDVDYVVGLNRLEDLLGFVEAPARDGVGVAVSDSRRERGVPMLGTRALPGHTRAFLKIQEGCNYSCTYCIIPVARGLSRSVPPDRLLAEVRGLAQAGYREIVLTGIHLGGYGQDLTPRTDLTALLERIAESGFISRLRLSSLDPREVPDRLLALIAATGTICDHLHVCAQAGNDWLLKQMRRNYDTAYYRDLLARVRERLPDAALGTDVIVGFPGESDALFEESLAYFASLPLSYFHVFPYSPRRGTPAALFADHVPPAIKKKRARKMRELGAQKQRAFYARFVGRVVPVLVEERIDKATGWANGFSRNYLPVVLPRAAANSEVPVYLERLENARLFGRALTGAVAIESAQVSTREATANTHGV